MRTMSVLLPLSFFFLLLTQGCLCDRPKTNVPPKKVLIEYLEKVINITRESEKEDLLKLSTGELKAALLNIDSEMFVKNYLQRKLEIHHFEVISETLKDDRHARVLFYIGYTNPSEGDQVPVQSVVQNEVELEKVGGRWLIDRIVAGNSSLEFLSGKSITVDRKDIKSEEYYQQREREMEQIKSTDAMNNQNQN